MQSSIGSFISSIVWNETGASVNNVVLRLERAGPGASDGRQDIVLHKTKLLIDQYRALFDALPEFHPKAILELGIWKGGSVVLWHEVLQPKVHVAIDVEHGEDCECLRRYAANRSADSTIKTIWGFDQQDKRRLHDLVHSEFPDGLDLVIDDASHLYRPTLASFEALFPLMRPGALYIVEDWAWAHWKEFSSPNHPWANEAPLTDFVHSLIESVGTSPQLINRVIVHQGLVAVERGSLPVGGLDPFVLADQIRRREAHTPWNIRFLPARVLVTLRSLLRRARHLLLRLRSP